MQVGSGHTVTCYDSDRLNGLDAVRELRAILHFFEGWCGPLGSLTIAESPNREALAMSYPRLVTVAPTLLSAPATMLLRFLPHEIAHQWFGLTVKFGGAGSLWLQESLPEYLQLLFNRHRFGQRMFSRQLQWTQKAYEDGKTRCADMPLAVASTGLPGIVGEMLAAKGTLAWHALAGYAGEDRLKSLLQVLASQHGTVTLSKFLDLAEVTMGLSLADFIRYWLDDVGLPLPFALNSRRQ